MTANLKGVHVGKGAAQSLPAVVCVLFSPCNGDAAPCTERLSASAGVEHPGQGKSNSARRPTASKVRVGATSWHNGCGLTQRDTSTNSRAHRAPFPEPRGTVLPGGHGKKRSLTTAAPTPNVERGPTRLPCRDGVAPGGLLARAWRPDSNATYRPSGEMDGLLLAVDKYTAQALVRQRGFALGPRLGTSEGTTSTRCRIGASFANLGREYGFTTS